VREIEDLVPLGKDRELGAAGNAKTGEQTGDVGLDRLAGQAEMRFAAHNQAWQAAIRQNRQSAGMGAG
jgi:hypothetical protein